MTTAEKLTALRRAMQTRELDAYYLSDLDPHQSEYVADHWKSRTWLSGFDGSAGSMVVTQHTACLWTDSRYFLQAEQQLAGSGIQLMRQGEKGVPTIKQWLLKNLAPGDVLGRDGRVVAVNDANALEAAMQQADIRVEYRYDPLADIWTDRPLLPATTPFEHGPEFTQTTRAERLSRLQDLLRKEGLAHYLLIGLDEIAWLLSVRAEDVAYNPLCLSFLLVRPDGATWFCGVKRVPAGLREKLAADGVTLADYPDILPELQRINATDEPLGMDLHQAPVAIYQAGGGSRVQGINSPVGHWKSIKGDKEIAHIRKAMARDGVALLRLRRWLSEVGKTNEVAVSRQLTAMRAEQPHYFGDSFPAIVGYRGNGAIVHYHARPESCAEIEAEGLLLLDSGGQYFDGTTDITRTFALSTPTADQRLHFTLVLQGHIDLAMARFPVGTVGRQLDVLARQPLWQHQLNYGHGTGHGVGYFLNVHEGPMGIRNNATKGSSREALKAGQILSNEPGYYRTGEYGIRIENLVLVKEASTEGWLEFEDLTVFPIERSLVEFDLLSKRQRAWLADYHRQVEAAIRPLLTEQDEIEWLSDACAGWDA